MEGTNTRVYTTTDNEGNTVEVHEETYFVEGDDAATRLSSSLTDSAQTRQVTETLADGSTVITTTITTVGDDGVETEEIITETIPPPAAVAVAADAKADDHSELHDQQLAGRDPSAHQSGSGGTGGLTSKPIVAQYAEDEYSEYKPPKRYEKQQKDSAADKLAPKVTIMGLPKDHQHKTAASGLVHGKSAARVVSAREDHSEDGGEHGAVPAHQDGSHADALAGSHEETQSERGAVENQPVVRTDVARESDRNEEEELPEKGLARNLLSRFKDIESEAQKQKQYRPSGVGVKPTPTPLRAAVREISVTSQNGGGESHAEPQEKSEAENQPVIRTDVVKESDKNLAEELPETGLARNLLSKFKSIESSSQSSREYKPSGVASRDSTDSAATWSRSSKCLSSASPVSGGHSEPKFEGGEVENVPQARTDVAKESSGSTAEELPERGLTQNLLSKFKAIESEVQETKLRRPPSAVLTPRGESRTSATSGEGLSSHSEPAVEGGEFENQPQVRTDVARESDANASEDLPEAGLARNLLSRFKNIESEARESQRAQFKPSGVASKATPSKIQIMAGRSSYGGDVGRPKLEAEAAVTAAESAPNLESGEFENVPQVRTDVVRESDGQTEELPNRGLASSLLSRFKSIEAEASARKDYVPSGVGSKPTPTPLGGSKGHVHSASAEASPSASDGTVAAGSSEPTVEGGEFENQPAERPAEVACEGQRRDLEELPEQGLAQGLLSKFKNLEEGASSQKDYRPSGVGRKSLSGYGAGSKKSADDE